MARMKELDEENKRLKKMYAEKSMQNEFLKEAFEKSGEVVSQARDGRVGGALSICQRCFGMSGVQH